MTFKSNLIWIIAILVVTFSISNSIIKISKNNGDNKQSDRLTNLQRANISSGDIGVKVFLSRLNNNLTAAYKLNAYKNYKQSIPSPQALRRLGVFEETILKKSGNKWFKLISKAKHKDSRKYIAEQIMWLDIFNSSYISMSKSNAYETRINKLDIGPLKNLALAQLYKKSHQNEKMLATNKAAYHNSYIDVLLVSICIIIAILSFFVGIFILIRFIEKRKNYNDKIIVDLDDGNGLLEGFVFYIISFSIAKYCMGSIIGKKAIANQSNEVSLLFQILITIAAFLVAMLAYSLWKISFRDAIKKIFGATNIKENFKWGFFGYLALVPLIYISFLISSFAFSGYKTMEHPLQGITGSGGLTLILTAFLAVIIAPLVEEYAFRGMLYGALRSKMNVVSSCIISGSIFSILHPTMPGQFLPLMILGAGFALLREKTGTLLPSIICHAINNAVTFIAIILIR